MKKIMRYFVFGLIGLLLSACAADKPDPSSAVHADKTKGKDAWVFEDTPEEKAAIRKELELEKLSAYTALNNFVGSRMQDVLLDYFEEFGYEEKPVIDKHFSSTLLSISKYNKEDMKLAFQYATKEPGFETIDPYVAELESILNELTPLLDEAYDYYEVKGYVDDQFAKGKTLHAQIVKAHKGYEEAAEKFMSALDEVADAYMAETLKELLDSDQQVRYSVLKFMMDADALSEEMQEQGITADNVLQLDMQKFKEKYDILAQDLQILIDYQEDTEMLQKEGINKLVLERIVNDSKEVKIAASNIMDRVNKKQKVDDFHLRSNFFRKVERGTPENYNDKLNSAVNAYNRLSM